MAYTLTYTGQFKKDYKLAKRRGLDISLLKSIVTKLVNGLARTGTHSDLFNL